MYMCLYFIHINRKYIHTNTYVCLIPNEAHEKVSNIYTHKYFILPKKIQNINKMMNGGHLLENNYSTIYIYMKLLFIYTYRERERERESARKERFGRPIEIFVCPMPPPMPFYSYILTFSFIIQTNLNSQGNA